MQWHSKFLGRAVLFGLVVLLGRLPSWGASGEVQVAVVHSARWSQGDEVREGASEFLVLLEIARLQQAAGSSGLVALGDRRGLFSPGAEEALQQAVRKGLPVVKLASGGRVLPATHKLFLDGGRLTEEQASQVLAQCLRRYGPLPASPGERQQRLELFQQELNLAASPRLAAR